MIDRDVMTFGTLIIRPTEDLKSEKTTFMMNRQNFRNK